MKNITISLVCLLLFAIGCSPKGGPEQTLRMKDGREIECRLLSVRPNGLLVDTSRPPAYTIGDVKAGLYLFDSINYFSYDPVSASKTISLSAFSGLAVGAATGFIIGENELASGSTDVVNGPAYAFALGICGIVAGIITGVIINEASYHTLDPSIPHERERIATAAVFKTEEPDELKKIK